MNLYTKYIGLYGEMFTKEFVKIKHHKNKIREVREDTVAKQFVVGKAQVLVVFEENDKEILLDDFSDPAEIKKYLGKKFLIK